MTDTIKKLLLCTSGVVLGTAFAALSAWFECNPWPCATDEISTIAVLFLFLAMASIVGSVVGYVTIVMEWWID